ncbi:MAG: hypothetical protein KGJ36_03150 [Acidobacteriota bacterium]|nr:hypothetical protein [Acidobacteriota bacterium]
MSRRIDIEITSLNGDVATWRAAGAKLPKGVLSASLVPGGAVVGTVYRADVEQYMEGMEVLSVAPAKTASPLDPRHERVERIPVVASGPDVVVTYAPTGRGPRRDGERRDAPSRTGGRPPTKARSDRERPARGPRAEGERPARETRGTTERAPRAERPERPARPARSPRADRSARPERKAHPAHPPMTTTYRNALLATLSPEQLPVAEQLLRGGMPAVRAAVAEQNKNASEQGRPTVDPATIDRIAEELLGKTNLALWRDRAAGAIGAGRELRLRDLRAVVTSAKTVTLDDESRAQLKELQTALTTRLDALRTQWTEKLEAALGATDVPEALRLVARPPDMSTRVSADVAPRVIAMTSAALTAEQDGAQWRNIVTLAAETSIRRNVKPQGIPEDDESRAVALKNAGAIPELAKLLGMKVPPPPPPTRAPRRPVTRRAS